MYGPCHGADPRHRARNQAVDEIEVMDHQVEDDADIGAPARPRAGADALHVKRRIVAVEQPGLGEDIAFLVADGQNKPDFRGKPDQLVGLVEVVAIAFDRTGFSDRRRDVFGCGCGCRR